MRRSVIAAIAAALAAISLPPGASAQDKVTVSSCAGEPRIPVTFEIDCTHLANPQSKEHCVPFVMNQACKVSPAYRKITGINLERLCKTFTYTIYDKDNWPHKEGDAGGIALKCGADYMAQYSVDGDIKMASGPYDTHEILHVYQQLLGALPYQHILFGPSQAEAMKLVGDSAGFERAISEMKKATAGWETAFEKEASRPASDRCVSAEVQTEETLYLENNDNVYQFYRKAGPSPAKDMNSRLARMNRIYDSASAGQSRQFLLAHGCPPF
jgi:hypothetical protein